MPINRLNYKETQALIIIIISDLRRTIFMGNIAKINVAIDWRQTIFCHFLTLDLNSANFC